MISYGEKENVNTLKDFSYEVIFPKNQRNKEVGYYDLLVQPGKNETIQLKLNNLSTHKMTLTLKFNSAKTNGSGVIEYGPNNFFKDPSLTYDFSEIVTGPDKVEIDANNSKVVTLMIHPPIEPFEGYIVGGIQVKPLDNVAEKNEKGSDVVINEFAFLIGVLLSESDVNKIKPELEFHSISVDTNGKNAQLILNFSNKQPVFAEGMSLAVAVRKKSDDRVIFELNRNRMRMAPNTQINVPIPLQYKLKTPGVYTMQTHVTLKGGESWSWEQDFDISEKDIPKLNTQLTKMSNESNTFFIILLVVVIIVGSTILLFVWYKRHRRNVKKWT
ncbi:DUF916 and DUF3324 domain-containing protein [Enterococcus sp. AZ126]|uniref:DUF916 and DUF3324 domain-containing protein n=1 Tax=Enterococcus sp. AZ126 TaxID=2774635 RepID=UPI003F688C9A